MLDNKFWNEIQKKLRMKGCSVNLKAFRLPEVDSWKGIDVTSPTYRQSVKIGMGFSGQGSRRPIKVEIYADDVLQLAKGSIKPQKNKFYFMLLRKLKKIEKDDGTIQSELPITDNQHHQDGVIRPKTTKFKVWNNDVGVYAVVSSGETSVPIVNNQDITTPESLNAYAGGTPDYLGCSPTTYQPEAIACQIAGKAGRIVTWYKHLICIEDGAQEDGDLKLNDPVDRERIQDWFVDTFYHFYGFAKRHN